MLNGLSPRGREPPSPTFVQLVVALQEAEPGAASSDLLALLAGDVLLAGRLELFQIFKGDVVGQVLEEGPVLGHDWGWEEQRERLSWRGR